MIGGLSGYHAFKLYFAMCKHFERGSYNIFQQKGKIRYPESSFEKRNDKAFFYRLGSEYLKGDLANFFMANIMADKKHVSEMTDLTFREWKSKMHRIDHLFESDLNTLSSIGCDFRDLFKTVSGGLPIILQVYNGGHVNIETICIIDDIVRGEFLERWNQQISDKFIYPEIANRIVKYKPFIQYDKPELSEILKKQL